MNIAFYDAENCLVGPRDTFQDWTPDDARLFVLMLQGPGFDDQDWLLVWEDVSKPEPFRSVFFLGGIPWEISEPQIEKAFAQVIGH